MIGIKHIYADPYHVRVLGQIPERDAHTRRRAGREKPTSLAQEFYNLKLSCRELMLYLYVNFTRKDFFVTLTYDDDHLPPDKETAEKMVLRKYIRRLRDTRKRREDELKYIHVTEGLHGKATCDFLEDDTELEDKRIHHHLVINGTGPGCYEELKSLWSDVGGGYVRIEPLEIRCFPALARYMTKEAREFGRAKPGDRTWKRSMNLTKYRVEYEEIKENGLILSPPPGAVDYEAFHEKNPYGFSDCIGDHYLLFPNEPMPDVSYNQSGRKKKPPL